MDEKKWINKWTRGRAMPSSTARLTSGHSGWSSTSGHTESASKNIQSTTAASWPSEKEHHEVDQEEEMCK